MLWIKQGLGIHWLFVSDGKFNIRQKHRQAAKSQQHLLFSFAEKKRTRSREGSPYCSLGFSCFSNLHSLDFPFLISLYVRFAWLFSTKNVFREFLLLIVIVFRFASAVYSFCNSESPVYL